MEITCWGARGSIPVSGRDFVKYGGDTACLQIRTGDGRTVIIDAGTGIRRLGRLLLEEGVTDLSLMFTHAHWDHLLGLPFFGPLYAEGTRIELFGAAMAQTSVRDMVKHTMKPPFFPVRVEDLAANMEYQGPCADHFDIGTLVVEPFPLSHPNGGLGYKLRGEGKTFVFLTDNELGHQHEGGLVAADYSRICSDADLLVHDAEYTPEEAEAKKTWGHSSYVQAVEMALEAGVPALGLFHHNHDRTDAEVDAIVDKSQALVAERGASMKVFAVAQDMVLPL